MTPSVLCSKCGVPIEIDGVGTEQFFKCGSCGCKQLIRVFPAVRQDAPRGAKAEKVVFEQDASCFFHPEKVAATVCQECGVYLCNLCDIEVDEQHLCPNCFEKSRDSLKNFNNKTILYDEILLSISLLSALICGVGALIAPFVFAACFYFWNKVNTPYKRSKWRFVLAMLVSLLVFASGIAFVVILVVKEGG